MNLLKIDTRRDDVDRVLLRLRERLSPRGDIVSEEGQRRTIEVFGEALTPNQVVERICHEVRTRGVEAVLDYSHSLDRARLTAETLRVPRNELEQAHRKADPKFLGTIGRIRKNIERFQNELVPRDIRVPLAGGGYLSQRYLPLARVGICVPGGAAAYPSTVLMTAVPAQAAGVKQLVVVAPPTAYGAYNQDLLATCHELGIDEIYRIGGAQGVAAMAYGLSVLPKVDKIVGPGNLFVALAKRHVYGDTDIDSIAGPSEVVVIGDENTRADYTAADLIAQAEHSPGSGVLVTWSERLWRDTAQEIERQLAHLDRGELARKSLEDFGALILARDADEACRIADLMAPEHLHINTANAESLLAQIPHAGAAFLGPDSPVAVGDYAAGPSHVLPTGGTARFFSALSSAAFVRSTSVIRFEREDLLDCVEDIRVMADKEGLSAHRASVDLRAQE